VLDVVCPLSGANRDVLRATLTLAREIARERPEGKHVGTLFTIGRPDRALASSRPLILDPLAGHAPASTHVADLRLRGTVKELAQIDGAFIVAEDGTFVSGGRYLDVAISDIDIPLGLGTRHLAAAAASRHFEVVAVAVSQAGIVRVFCRGEIVATLT
jgi:DNA integrity scanning protein DisA with diadenylate cyclase activity